MPRPMTSPLEATSDSSGSETARVRGTWELGRAIDVERGGSGRRTGEVEVLVLALATVCV
ncbi:MAG: hypothetical protein JJT89_17530 [Nitriliruptoraceae bacterium]|nr:hypothetical protein [Nitriliruptoraceae bacterium]